MNEAKTFTLKMFKIPLKFQGYYYLFSQEKNC